MAKATLDARLDARNEASEETTERVIREAVNSDTTDAEIMAAPISA